MAIELRSLFPLALPGMLALLGWWWFFSRKKGHVSSHDEQVEAGAVQLRADSAIKEPLPMEDVCAEVVSTPLSVTEPPEKELSTVSKLPAEPPALLRAHPPHRRSESSGSLPNTIDVRLRPGTHRDNSAKLELALTGGETKSIPLECPLSSPKGVLFPHKSAEVCKQESPFSRVPGRGQPGYPAAPPEKHGSGERARETGGAEGTGDAALGEKMLEEGLLSQEHVLELENSKAPNLASLEGEEEKGKSSSSQVGPVQEEEYVAEKLPSRFTESAHTELPKDDAAPAPPIIDAKAQDRDVEGELGNEESLDRNEEGLDRNEEGLDTNGEGLDRNEEGLDRNGEGLDRNEEIEQAAFQIISQVISEASEQVLATAVGKVAGCVYQASQLQGQEEESCVPVHQQTVLGSDTGEPAIAEAGAAPLDAALPSPGLPAEGSAPPKTYVSCLNSPLSSPIKDSKPKISAHHISLAPCLPPTTPGEESPDRAGILVEDATCVTCMSDSSQSVPFVASPGHCSDSLSTSGLEDSCTETSSSPRDKAITPPLPESTVPFSNGVLKGELSDLGAEDGWTMDVEADHSGGSDRNSMDSVDSCCSLKKTESFQNAQAGSNPKKVDLIIWEIEVPKHLVGRLIGKQGRYVSFLKQTSGAKIYISTLPYTQSVQICHIEGSQHHVDKALNLIGKKFKELNLTNIYAPPLPSLALPSLPMTSWLMLPDGITVEVIVVNQVNAGHLFVQQHTHPTFHALRSLDQQMYLCYSQPGIPTLPTPVEITVICAAPGADGAWWRAQVVASYEETNEVEIRYVDYGGYKRVKVDVLRQIRSDFVTLPFQGAEVLLDSVMPLSDDDQFSPEADAAMSEMTGNTALLAQVTSYSPTGLPLIQLWSVVGDEVVLINRSLVERGLAQWVDSYYASL
ncbi:A-kinase anchor protein 1, mitochondrial [Trachypithecus francoisi]|uniref:A-kinase anchor protein 1, mitochondrial n=1 Tax=Trachypithecus francoisi TaxID=54180 RepID=UPI00141A74EB|nr:A-kinase anchor protein 1, mitochondrial [Trachypithecus francoisi]XP_033039491.1 A-kinase anchor protein 1, mitochondrial [Trachypithecus francoisi]XP_033039492.1 A-kinase anchor protein 1, mitochondrial [Trachypithecus francoisi]XP_033039493.1 A-kinase anchor protein 1, mitochondrial [Trachypithecus francoisi]XP_033039494.1 A-kinase anchor protein 1, mitochondrial [Trachypithecus francoisi]XP_033039495.1 A-kinase anchor protein 1, mitochondrial [Trachypithecus francoisi]